MSDIFLVSYAVLWILVLLEGLLLLALSREIRGLEGSTQHRHGRIEEGKTTSEDD